MWRRLQQALWRLWGRPQRDRTEGPLTNDRAHFWAEVRQGQREAESNSRP